MKKTILTAAIAGIALASPVYLTVEITTAICIALIPIGVWLDSKKA